MLSTVEVSAEVERRRGVDPHYLTSTMVSMGTLLTEGDHLYLDRSGRWQEALRMIIAAARQEEDRANASAIILRDLPDVGHELHEFLLGEGFLRLPIGTSWVRELDFTDDAQFLAGLSKKHRYHQRANVLGWENAYHTEIIVGGTEAARQLDSGTRDQLHALYRNVHARNLSINVFPLPRRLLDCILDHPCWELIVLRLIDKPDQPVAFAVQYTGPEHVQPVFVGLDYDFVVTHHSYQQTLWQTLRSGQRHQARRVRLGMTADLQKARFGAEPEQRLVYVQLTDTFNIDILNQLTEEVARGGRRIKEHAAP
jgi:hypothetical protein